MSAYYNEIDPYAAEWLRNLIKAGHIADGEVDTRSIIDVSPDDIRHFDQCHFFAGIAGWSHALRLAGWADDRKVWTGSCPCQPFSVAGKGKGTDDERHLWPHFFRLIRSCRPPVVMGEQVAGAAGYGWLDGVRSDLESERYAIDGVDIPACATNAPHIRQRLYWVANTKYPRRDAERLRGYGETGEPLGERQASSALRPSENGDVIDMADADNIRSFAQQYRDNRAMDRAAQRKEGAGDKSSICPKTCGSNRMSDAKSYDSRCEAKSSNNISSQTNRSANRGSGCGGSSTFWHDAIWLNGADGKTRRAEPSIRLLANGVPARVGKLRAYGNAIVPPLAAEVIRAFMEKGE